jgi:hypothetical protein
MIADDDVTRWIRQLGEGDEAAAERIWERYFDRLVRLVRERLQGSPRRAADEEDVALSALYSCFRGVTAGRYPLLLDREDLWRVLVTISAHKALDQMRAARAALDGWIGPYPASSIRHPESDTFARHQTIRRPMPSSPI